TLGDPLNGYFVLIATLDNPEGTSITGIMDAIDDVFLGYDLQTSLGPVSGIGRGLATREPHHTTSGDFFHHNRLDQRNLHRDGRTGTLGFSAVGPALLCATIAPHGRRLLVQSELQTAARAQTAARRADLRVPARSRPRADVVRAPAPR